MRATPTRCTTTFGPTSSCRGISPGRIAPSTSTSSMATRRSAWCSTRTRPICRTCKPACIRRAFEACGSDGRSFASAISTRSSTTIYFQAAPAATPGRAEKAFSDRAVASVPGVELLLPSYRQMKLIREFEERLHVEIATGEIPGFTHLYAGQEAVAVGVCEQLSDSDYIVSTHRGHGHCIAKGCDVGGMMKEIYGRKDGLCHGKGGSMHIADMTKGMLGANAIVGGGPPIAVGAAIACKLRGNRNVSVAFGGDGSANQGRVFEAMNMAVVLRVPAIFVLENNGYSEHTGAAYAVGSGDLAGRSRGFGMPAECVDGA